MTSPGHRVYALGRRTTARKTRREKRQIRPGPEAGATFPTGIAFAPAGRPFRDRNDRAARCATGDDDRVIRTGGPSLLGPDLPLFFRPIAFKTVLHA
ncbi:MAG: hypothetical protein ACYTG0_21700 [Planctomycetota bacterium]